MPKKSNIKIINKESLEAKTKQLMQMIAQQKFHVVGIESLHTAVIPGFGKKPLPASLAEAVTNLNNYLATPDDPNNIELIKVGQDPNELKYARAIAQFTAIIQTAIETNHPSRHPETQKFYEQCLQQILDEPLVKEGGAYYEEFQERYEEFLIQQLHKIINPDYWKVIDQIELVFKSFLSLEDHLKEYIPDIDTLDNSAKYFLLISAKQMLLCRSEKELHQCVTDFRFALTHSGLTLAQQEQLTVDIESCENNYKKIFQADRRFIKLIGAAALQIGALGADIASLINIPGMQNEKLIKNGLGLGLIIDRLKQSATKEYCNILPTPVESAGCLRYLGDLLAPYLLDTGKSLIETIQDETVKIFQNEWIAIKEKPSEQLKVAAATAATVSFVVPPLMPILLPTAACLTLTSIAISSKEVLSELWTTNEAIGKECDSIKASYERDYNRLIQEYGTPEEIKANKKREDRYKKSNKPDLELADESSFNPCPAIGRYSLFQSEHQEHKHPKQEDLDKDKPKRPN